MSNSIFEGMNRRQIKQHLKNLVEQILVRVKNTDRELAWFAVGDAKVNDVVDIIGHLPLSHVVNICGLAGEVQEEGE